MNYTLMHKAIPVAELTLNEATGSIQHIDGVLHGEHLPAGVSIRRGIADRAALNEWWADHSICFWLSCISVKGCGTLLSTDD